MASSKPESGSYIRVEKRGNVAEVVLDRGKELNKMDEDFFDSFHEAISQADADPEVRVILIWAEGPIFTAGLDLFKAGPALAASTRPFKLGSLGSPISIAVSHLQCISYACSSNSSIDVDVFFRNCTHSLLSR
jgi:enoyl-CoA hydratase/carnithine racemase